MKRFVALVAVSMMVSMSYANTPSDKPISIESLGPTFQTQQVIKPNQNDLTIVYGGEDFSSHAAVDSPTTLA